MDFDHQPPTLYSIGHSNHSIEFFLDLLALHGIQAIADVRSSPYSRYNPQFSKDDLERTLQAHGIAYVFLGKELGARRDERECYFNGKIDYNAIPKMPSFQSGVARLVDGASKMTVAMLCAEKDPLTCHRTILIARHVQASANVVHILANGKTETQYEAEERLLREHDLGGKRLFETREELLIDAYQQRGERIAYEELAPND